ncbi:hypothetical protein ABIB14_001542 [Arthrobacter sp. UYEF3]
MVPLQRGVREAALRGEEAVEGATGRSKRLIASVTTELALVSDVAGDGAPRSIAWPTSTLVGQR